MTGISAQRDAMVHAPLRMAVLAIGSSLLALALVACASNEGPVRVAAEADPGWILYTDLEERLMRATSFELHATMTTTGAIDADVNADLWLGEGQRARFAVKGVFQGKPVDALWISDGTRAQLRGGNRIGAPAETRDAFVRGLLAMGLMHNAAVLTAGEGPDHSGGGVRAFVRADRQRMAPEGLAIDLDVLVKNQLMGEATLTLDNDGLPRDRTQVVHFETGTMDVKEIYSGVRLNPALDPALFSLEPSAVETPVTPQEPTP